MNTLTPRLFRWTKASAALLALPLLALPLHAQDGGLYEDVPDPNASFVRVVGADLNSAVINNTALDGLDTGISPYVVITDPGDITISAGTDETVETIQPGTFYSLIVAQDGSKSMVTDTITLNPAQADVTFYNLSDLPSVDLFVPAAKAVAIPGVAANATGSVALKAPLTLDFEVREGDTTLATLPGIALERRKGVAIVFRGSGGTYELVSAENKIAN